MPRKQKESGEKLKPTSAPENAEKPVKAGKAARSAKTKSASAGTAAKKTAGKKPAAKTAAKKSAAKKAGPGAGTGLKARAKPAPISAPAAETAAKPSRMARTSKKAKDARMPAAALTGRVEDPIGDTTDGEAHRLLTPDSEPNSEPSSELGAAAAMMDAYRTDTASDAGNGVPEAANGSETGRSEEGLGPEGARPGREVEPQPEAHLDRLQKILSQAGVASRRHAEEMIVAGRVIVNGQVITQLGAKADPARDHIRVDGKLIHGVERHRTFLLNKPKGYVTTVSDPQGRPTVVQFFEKMSERLYPVGRLDYQSEGLLLMTNDGELANGLTRAAAGVEKVYVVKVAGTPTEEELDRLRSGVSIAREPEGSYPGAQNARSPGGRVRTAPASIRQIRPGENPWYEVVLTEGRNRELRKMFQAVGHFVEKIRRVGYGPLSLDVEPGKFRELTAEEVNALRLTAEGKLKPKRPRSSAMLPKEAGRAGGEARPAQRPFGGERRSGDIKPRQSQGFSRPPFRRERTEGRVESRREGRREGIDRKTDGRGSRPAGLERRPESRPPGPGRRPESRPPGFDRQRFNGRQDRPGFDRQRFDGRQERRGGQGFNAGRQLRGRAERPADMGGGRPRFEEGSRPERPQGRGRGGFQEQERRPRPEYPRRDAGADRGAPDRGARPNRFGPPRFGRERGGSQSGGEWKPRPGGERPQRPGGRSDTAPGAGGERFGGVRRTGGGNPRRGPGFGARPEGFRKPGFRNKPGGGPPRRNRG